MSKIIPIIDQFSQTVRIQLGGQSCTINLYQKATGFFCDMYVNDELVIGGVICQNLNRIVRNSYLGFIGDLIFADTQGSDDPSSPGLGTRFLFSYLEAADVAGVE